MTEYKHEVCRPADYNDGTIHSWNGGDCPVHPKTVVKVYFEDQLPVKDAASEFRWTLDTTGLDDDIIAFRVVKEYVGPKVIWVNEYDDTGFYSPYTTKEEAIRKASPKATRIAVKYVESRND